MELLSYKLAATTLGPRSMRDGVHSLPEQDWVHMAENQTESAAVGSE